MPQPALLGRRDSRPTIHRARSGIRGSAVLLLSSVALLASSAPAHAEPRPWSAPQPGPVAVGSESLHAPDVIEGGHGAPKARAAAVKLLRAHSSAVVRRTPDGLPVRLEVSPSYARNPAAEQSLVDFLGTRLHGPELGRLTAIVATPAEIDRVCPDALPATTSRRPRCSCRASPRRRATSPRSSS